MNSLLSYAPGNSIIHKMNPITKLLLAFCICIAGFTTKYHLYLVILIIIDLLIGVIGGITKKALKMFKNLLVVNVFLFVLQVLFVRSGTPVIWFITDEGISLALLVVLRLICACLPLALVLNLTQITDLSNALVTVLHIPYQYAFTTTTAINFIPVFFEEMNGIMEAQTARGVEFDNVKGIKKLKLIMPLCVPLLISSVRKIDLTAISAEVRGFDLRTRKSVYKKYPFKLVDYIAIVFSLGLIAIAICLPFFLTSIA